MEKRDNSKYMTEQDFRDALSDEKISKFVTMLTSELYSFRVKKALYTAKEIDAKEFLYNDNVFNLPLAMKNDKGEILINNDVLDVYDRFLLAEGLIQKGDALSSFMIDHNDELYAVLKNNIKTEDKISEQDYVQVFNEVYKKVSNILLEDMVSELIGSNEDLRYLVTLNENLVENLN